VFLLLGKTTLIFRASASSGKPRLLCDSDARAVDLDGRVARVLQTVEPHERESTHAIGGNYLADAVAVGAKLARCGEGGLALNWQQPLARRAAMLHARGQFLANIASLLEIHRLQFVQIGVKREHPVAAEVASLRYAKRDPVFVIGLRVRDCVWHLSPRADGAATQRGQARVFEGDAALGRMAGHAGKHGELLPRLDLDLGAELVHRQPLDQRVPRVAVAIDQQGRVALGDQEIEQDFALWRQQRGIDRTVGRDFLNVVCDEALQEAPRLRAGDGDDAAVFQKHGLCHAPEVSPKPPIAKPEAPPYSFCMSETFDLLIKGGITATPNGIAEADVGVRGGRIAAIGSLSGAKAAEIFDAKGLHVLPGVMDTQVHFREPGNEHKEDLETGSRAAVLGGVTAVFEMPNTSPPTTTRAAIEDKLARAKNRMNCDYAFYTGATPGNVGALGEMERLPGVCGVKAFLGSSTGTLLLSNPEDILAALKSGTRRMAVHSEDEDRLEARKDFRVTGDPRSHPVWRDAETARSSTERVIALARKAGRRLHVLHVTTLDELPLLADAHDFVTVETTPQHLTLAAPECYERLGTYAQMNPPIRGPEHREALWKAVQEGLIDVIGSDHAPHTREEKDKAYPDTPSGMPGVQTLATILLDHVNAGRLTLERFVDLTSAGAARIFGIAGKGRIARGYDADFTIVDLKKRRKIENSWIASRCGWTPFDGMTTTGWPVTTIIRGRTVMRDHALTAEGQGEPVRFVETLERA